MMNRIVSAAAQVVLPNGKTVVLKCHRHCDVFATLKMLNVEAKVTAQGFIAWDGQNEAFVDRCSAAKIAFAAGQIQKQQIQLFSEDLW